MKICIIGPAWPYRGGIAAFSERLANQFQSERHEVKLYTFTLQYPSFLFPGTTQYSEALKPQNLTIERRLSSVNPYTWFTLGRKVKTECYDLVILAYWMPFMSPCMGTVARIVRSNGHTRVVALCHNLVPHEKRIGDMLLTRWLLNSVHGVAALSQTVCSDAQRFVPNISTVASPHPIYDNFGASVSKGEACQHLGLDPEFNYILFFGLIRNYKGLDWLLQAIAMLGDKLVNTKLIIAGEFYGDGEKYHAMAQQLGITERLIWHTRFVPDSEVRYYFSAADLIVQPYKTATQSGVTQIAYQFGKPMIVTRVGGLPEIVPHGKVGLVVEPNAEAVSHGIEEFYTLHNPSDFVDGLAEEKQKYSWGKMSEALLSFIP